MTFDVLTTNAIGLQHLLDQNKITSVQIVQAYFVQIDRHESSLNALISTAPRDDVLANARTLDAERQTSRIRSPFHGVPIILKDSFVTASHLGMSTTAGSHAFIGSLASKNGAITQRLLDAGLIVLGKGNMTVSLVVLLNVIFPKIDGTLTGVCRHENDHDDVRLVCAQW